MRHSLTALPPLTDRIAAGRPVLDQDQITDFTQRLLRMTSSEIVDVTVTHTARVVTRLAHGQVLTSDDGENLSVYVNSKLYAGSPGVQVSTNQLDDTVLHAIVQQAEAINRELLHRDNSASPMQKIVRDDLVPVTLWHEDTVRAMQSHREILMPALITPVAREHFQAAGFVGLIARCQSVVHKGGNLDGLSVYYDETDAEVNLTARSLDGKTSGWAGQAMRNWSTLDTPKLVAQAVESAKRNANPVAVEPGRRTAILSPAAVAQLTSFLYEQFAAQETDKGWTAFSTQPLRNGGKRGQRVVDPRITLTSHPNDLSGGYCPYFAGCLATPPMTWIEHGVLKDLQYEPQYAMSRGKSYAAPVTSFRITGGTTSVDEMIAHCKEGIYVNRLSDMYSLHQQSGLVTGVTRDGCFLVKNGKIIKAVKNFRIIDSPLFALNKLEALGVPQRAAFGYAPRGRGSEWPLLPVIVPPMMVQDFNFAALSDAV